MNVDEGALRDRVHEGADELAVPGVSVGVYHAGQEHYAFHGVTSIENPLPVDERTLFQFGSTGKTFTATTMMRLVERGQVELEAPVRRYVPELALKDEHVAAEVTVLQLMNHTAGWDGDFFPDTGQGDDALARFVEAMRELEQLLPPGRGVSYNNAAVCLAGRVIEKVTGSTFEGAVKELVLDPLGLQDTLYFASEIMVRRFVVGHERRSDDSITMYKSVFETRSGNPAGANVSATAADQIKWARFHLGNGTGPDETRILSEELLHRMKVATATCPGSAIGDAVGISWLLRDVDGTQLVMHGGTTLGQHSEFVLVPERDFAFVSMTNCGPNGAEMNDRLLRWVLDTYLGIEDVDPEPEPRSEEELAPYLGTYETIAATCTVGRENGGLVVNTELKPEAIAQLFPAGDEPPEEPPVPLGMLAGPGDRYIVTDGPAKAMKGYFVRSETGDVEGLHFGGRLALRTGGGQG